MRYAAALLALSCAAQHAAAVRRAQLQAPADFHADSFLFAGNISPQYSCLVLTDLDDGGTDTLRVALGDPRCVRVAIAAGLTIAVTQPLVVTRSVRIECDYGAAVIAPLVPPVPQTPLWDSLGGAAPQLAATGGAGVADNATLAGALPGACALDGGGVTRLITVPRTAPSGLRVNVTNVGLRSGFAGGAQGRRTAAGPSSWRRRRRSCCFTTSPSWTTAPAATAVRCCWPTRRRWSR